MAAKYTLDHSAARTIAAVVGSAPLALAIGIALAYALPLPLTERYLIGSYAVFPLWVGLACAVFLVRSGRRAWLLLGSAALGAVIVAGVAHWLGRGPHLPGAGP